MTKIVLQNFALSIFIRWSNYTVNTIRASRLYPIFVVVYEESCVSLKMRREFKNNALQPNYDVKLEGNCVLLWRT